MKLSAVRIPCDDLKASLTFYRDILGLELKFGSPDEGWLGFDGGGCDLLIEPQAAGEFEAGRFLGISFQIDDLRSRCRELSVLGVRFVGAPERQPWGGVLAHFEDNSGNVLTLVQPG